MASSAEYTYVLCPTSSRFSRSSSMSSTSSMKPWTPSFSKASYHKESSTASRPTSQAEQQSDTVLASRNSKSSEKKGSTGKWSNKGRKAKARCFNFSDKRQWPKLPVDFIVDPEANRAQAKFFKDVASGVNQRSREKRTGSTLTDKQKEDLRARHRLSCPRPKLKGWHDTSEQY